jgi:enoyl-CoA hydratase/carnithine racemase
VIVGICTPHSKFAFMSDRVTWTVTDGVADVRLNRPEKMNALDADMFRGLVEVGATIATDSKVRAVVLSGVGRSFCAGLDFGSFQAMAGGASDGADGAEAPVTLGEVAAGRITHFAQQAVWTWQEIPVPVIAAVHGVALGGGCQLALGADLRYCTADSQFSILEIRWGLIPDMTGTYTLTKLVGLDVAKELTFTGRMVGGTEAVQIGMATRVAQDPVAEALKIAGEIAQKSPHAIRAAKRLMNAASTTTPAAQFELERKEISQLVGSPNQVESIMAYFEKRAPSFSDVL